MEKMTLEEYINKIEELLTKRYGIGIDDCTDKEVLSQSLESGETPEEFVSWIGEKYNLTDISRSPFGF